MISFPCDFCIIGQVDFVGGQGKQEIVKPTKLLIKKSKTYVALKFRYRCKSCIENGITTTPDNLSVHNCGVYKKAEVKYVEPVEENKNLSSGPNFGVLDSGSNSVAKQIEKPIQRVG